MRIIAENMDNVNHGVIVLVAEFVLVSAAELVLVFASAAAAAAAAAPAAVDVHRSHHRLPN